MPRYKCEVDLVYTYDIEVSALDKEDALMKAQHIDINDLTWNNLLREVVEVEELPEIAALFTYPPLPDTASDRMKEAYKVMVEEIQLASQQPIIDDSLNKESSIGLKEKIRKQSDTTKITQVHYDGIMSWYRLYLNGEVNGVRTTQQLTNHINKLSGLNKSRSVYSKIWNGGVDRESLPKGE